MLCVPRSWAASPCVIERITVQLVGELGGLGKGLAELLALDLGGDRAHVAAVLDRGEGLGIERLLVGDPAGKEDVDHRVGLGGDRRVVLEVRPGLQPEDVGQGQSPEPDRADRQETSATDRVVETGGLPSSRLLCSGISRIAHANLRSGCGIRRRPRNHRSWWD